MSTMSDIQNILHDKYYGFHLVFTKPDDVYKNVESLYTRKGSKLYISVKFPISPYNKPLSLFKVLSFPVSINDTAKHATQLLDLPDYLVVTADVQYYTSLNQLHLNKCKGSKLRTCKMNKILYPITRKSCIFALFRNDKTMIKDMCDFRFLTNHLTSKLVELTATSVLVYNINVLQFDCK